MSDLTGKRVLIVIAYQDFQDHEFKPVHDYLSMLGAHIRIASSSLGTATGKFGMHVDIDLLFSDVRTEYYDALVVIGGPGAVELRENHFLTEIIHNLYTAKKIVAAICIAPTILARAGILKGKKATVWTPGPESETVQSLTSAGAKYHDQPVVIDGRIITANGPEAAHDFAHAIADKLD